MSSLRIVVLVGATVFFAYSVYTRFNSFRGHAVASKTQIVCDEDVHDFGSRRIGDQVTHVFTLRNTGLRDLELESVRPGCGCSTAEFKDKVIKPGSSVTVQVKISLDNLRGAVEQHFVVKSNDPGRPALLLRTKSLVDSAIAVTPKLIDCGNVVSGKKVEGYVDIGATGDGRFQLLSVGCNSPLCRIKQTTVEEGKVYRVSVETIGELPPGRWRASLRIRTDHPTESQITVPVIALIEPVEISQEK